MIYNLINKDIGYHIKIDNQCEELKDHIYNAFGGFITEVNYLIVERDSISITHNEYDGYMVKSKFFHKEKVFNNTIELLGFLCNGLFCNEYIFNADIWYLHGAAVYIKNKIVLLIAPRFSGKTTLTGMLCNNLDCEYLSDDIIPVLSLKNKVCAFPKMMYIRDNYLFENIDQNNKLRVTNTFLSVGEDNRTIVCPSKIFNSGFFTPDIIISLNREEHGDCVVLRELDTIESFLTYLNNCRDNSDMERNIANAKLMAKHNKILELTFTDAKSAVNSIINLIARR